MPEERRSTERYRVWFPMRVSRGEEEGLAITFDASERGLLIGSAIQVDRGDVLSVSFRNPTNYAEDGRVVQGTVVRVETNEDDPHGMWPRRVAVEFDEPVPDLEMVIAASLARQSSSSQP
jgi:hypothetical protein